MGQHVGMKEVRLVEEEDRMEPLAAQALHVGLDCQEEVRGGRRGLEAEGVAEVAVEVAAAERRVRAIGQPEARLQ